MAHGVEFGEHCFYEALSAKGNQDASVFFVAAPLSFNSKISIGQENIKCQVPDLTR